MKMEATMKIVALFCGMAMGLMFSFMVNIHSYPTHEQINNLCNRHQGVQSINQPIFIKTFVVCKDGYGNYVK